MVVLRWEIEAAALIARDQAATVPGAAPLSDDLAMPDSSELAVRAEFAGVVVAIAHGADERVGAGMPLVVLEAMKMEHEVLAQTDGVVRRVAVAVGDAVEEGQLLLMLEPGAATTPDGQPLAGRAPTEDGSSASSNRRSFLRWLRIPCVPARTV